MQEELCSDVWSFRREELGWIWERVSTTGERLDHSHAAFTDIDECIKDATRHGYVAPTRRSILNH